MTTTAKPPPIPPTYCPRCGSKIGKRPSWKHYKTPLCMSCAVELASRRRRHPNGEVKARNILLTDEDF